MEYFIMQRRVENMSEHPYLLNGLWLNEGTKVEVRSPFDQSVVGVTWNATPKHLESAIAASVAAFEVTRRMSAYERQSVLLKVVQSIKEQRESIAV
jgi:succinate-semialdehyde dehydrogenase/glutarate-semialdehyde dehydrogenase